MISKKYAERTKANLATVHYILRGELKAVLQELAAGGIYGFVTFGYRTIEEQDALYAKGRTKPGGRVTDARGGNSYHNYKVAADVLFLDEGGKIIWDGDHAYYTRFGQVAMQHGLSWGFEKNGKHWDRGHVNLAGFTIAEVREFYVRGGMERVTLEYIRKYDQKPASDSKEDYNLKVTARVKSK